MEYMVDFMLHIHGYGKVVMDNFKFVSGVICIYYWGYSAGKWMEVKVNFYVYNYEAEKSDLNLKGIKCKYYGYAYGKVKRVKSESNNQDF